MKKIILALLAISNVLIFFIVLSVYKEKDVSDIYNFRNFQKDASRISISINNSEGIIDQEDFVSTVNNLRDKYQLTILYFDFNYESRKYTLFVDSRKDIDQIFKLATDTTLNFSENTKNYYSNFNNSDDAIHTFLLNNQIKLSIRPLAQLEFIPSGVFEFIANSQAELDGAISEFTEEFGDFIFSSDVYGNDSLDVQTALDEYLPFTLLISLASVLLLFFMLVQSDSKKIAIFQTLGLSYLKICRKLYASFFAYCLAVIVATQGILYWALVGAFNIRTESVIQSLLSTIAYQILGVVIILLMSYFLIKSIPKYQLLKNSNFARSFMNGHYVLQIITLILLLPLLTPKIDILGQHQYLLNYSINIQKENFQYAQLKEQYMYKYDTFDYLMEYFQNRDSNIINQNDALKLQAATYESLNNKGALLCSFSPIILGSLEIPVLQINENYIKQFPIYLSTGQEFKVASTDADVVYLIPESYLSDFKEDEFLNDVYSNEYEVVTIKDEQDFLDFSFLRTAQKKDLPYVFQLYKNGSFRLENSIFNDVYYTGDLEQAISQTEFSNKVDIFNTDDDLEDLIEGFRMGIIETMKILIPGIILIILVIVQYAYLYKKVNTQRNNIKKNIGFGRLRTFISLLIEFSLALCITLGIAIFKNIDIKMVLGIVVIYILTYIMTAFWPDKKKHTF
jgi:hypothetical protein